MQFTKKLSLATLSLASIFALAGCDQFKGDSSTIAKGDGIEVKQEDFNAELKDKAGEQVIQQMVLSDIFEKEVDGDKIKELKDQATQQTALLKEQYDDDDQFQTVLASSGFSSEKAYEKQLYLYSLMSEAISKNIDINDKELKKAYDDYQAPIEASHILVDDEDKAKDIIKQLDDGADFSKLAKDNSKDTTANNGGSLGEISKGQMVPEFEDAAFKLKEGEYTKEPVKTKYGYHVIKVTKKKDKGSFDDEKGQLKESLQQEKMQDQGTVNKIIKQLIDKYNVKINDDDLKDALNNFISENGSENKGGEINSNQQDNNNKSDENSEQDNN